MQIQPILSAYMPYAPAAPGTATLLHLNGTNGSTTFTDEMGKTWAANAAGPTISTAQSQFGGASLLVATDGISTANHADFSLTADFTIQFWARPTSWAVSYIVSKGKQGIINPYLFFLAADGAITFLASTNGGASWNVSIGSIAGQLVLNTWSYCVAQRYGPPRPEPEGRSRSPAT